MTGNSLPPPDREEWASLYVAFAILRKESERALSVWQVTVPQVTVLALLAETAQPLSVGKLAELMLLESPSVTSLVDRMCESGLVERLKDPHDRRKALVKLTNKGRQVHDKVRASAAAISNELFGVLSDKKREALKLLLQEFTRRNIRRLR
jgi:MarR family transcriptional regulator for hemolysin